MFGVERYIYQNQSRRHNDTNGDHGMLFGKNEQYNNQLGVDNTSNMTFGGSTVVNRSGDNLPASLHVCLISSFMLVEHLLSNIYFLMSIPATLMHYSS